MKITVIGFTALSVLASLSVSAANHRLSGEIYRLDTNDSELNASGEGGSKLRLANTSLSAGNCFKDGSGYVVIWVRDNNMGERMYSTLLAAQISDRQVSVLVSDSSKNSSGVCYAQQVRID